MVEIACHGGVAVTTAVLNALIGGGAREAEPGEFTQRAVLHGKLDILQAEAVADLVDARTTAARGLALSQLHGLLSSKINGLRESVLQIEALLAYDLDFPDEDDGPIAAGRITEAAQCVIDRLSDLLQTAPLAEVASDGALVVIAGAPNVGKSSLFNALVGSRRAIVTDLPGTTRDAIEARLDAPHWPLRLIDTAGLRETQDTVERLGIEVSEQHIRKAHVVLVCDDNDEQLRVALETVGTLTRAPLIPVRTKVDQRSDTAGLGGTVAVSATTGLGLEHLLASIEQQLAATLGGVPIDQPVLTRARHRVALEHARSEMQLFADAWASRSVPSVVAAVHVRSASTTLDELIGSVDVDDILEQVFRTFCVGK
jgi:tRNA modification GTPase